MTKTTQRATPKKMDDTDERIGLVDNGKGQQAVLLHAVHDSAGELAGSRHLGGRRHDLPHGNAEHVGPLLD